MRVESRRDLRRASTASLVILTLLLFAGCAPRALLAHDVTLRFDGQQLHGEGTLALTSEGPDVVLDARVAKVESVAADGHAVPFEHDGQRLVVHTARAGAHTLQLRWRVDVDGEAPFWFGYATPRWLPTRFDSSIRSTLRLRLEAPPGWTSVAAGREVEPGVFVVDRPSPPFLFALALGHFERLERGPFVLLGGDEAALARTERMAAFLTERTGHALDGPYTQVFVKRGAAQEAVGLALIDHGALTETDDWVFIHELSHQWFGLLLPCTDFDDFWLNEGFATFLTAAWKEASQGRAAYDEEVARWRQRSARVHDEGKDAPLSLAPPGKPRPRTPDARLQPRGVTYARGALLLHHLRETLGDATFWAVIRRYVRDNEGKDVTSESLRAALETVTGRDWRRFFEVHVYAVDVDPRVPPAD